MSKEKRTRDIEKIIDGRIAGWCKTNSTTAEELAKQLDISPTTLSFKRNSKTEWTLSELQQVSAWRQISKIQRHSTSHLMQRWFFLQTIFHD